MFQCLNKNFKFSEINSYSFIHSGRIKNLKCRRDGNCSVALAKAKKCKACRFRICTESGLDPEKVLGKEARKKYTHLRKIKVKGGDGFETALVVVDPDQDLVDQDSLPLHLEQVMSNYTLFFASMGMSNHMKNIVHGHKNVDIWNTEHSKALFQTFQWYGGVMFQFAEKTPMFKSLSKNDQKLLLKRNHTLFSCYLMAKYFTAGSGFDQLCVIYGPHLSQEGT